jgi:hypothetical protein
MDGIWAGDGGATDDRALHKFEQTMKGKPAYYWVSEDHQLIRIVGDEGKSELLRTTKEKALAAFKAE